MKPARAASWIALWVALWMVGFAGLASAEVGTRRALIIGINDYSASRLPAENAGKRGVERGLNDLRGAVNDAELMRHMLVGKYGFRAEQVTLLLDQDATRRNILEGIERYLIEPTRAGDKVVFHYSGHGSQVRNSKSPEADGLDESLVPADARRGVADIRDKELRRLFHRVLDKGARLVIVLDSCHSGSGVRNLPTGARARSVGPDLRDVADAASRGETLESRGALVFSAAQDDESAIEVSDRAGRYQGVLTRALVKALRSAAPDETAADIFKRTVAWTQAAGAYQHPVLEGRPDIKAAPPFGAGAGQVVGRTVALGGVDDGEVMLLGGWLHGLAPGSELRVLGIDPVVRLEVEELGGLQRARARVVSGSGADLSPGTLAEIVSWTTELEPLRVWIPTPPAGDQALKIARRWAEHARAGKFLWVDDPTETSPSHMLRILRDRLELVDLKARSVIYESGFSVSDEQGEQEALKLLPPDARLFVQLPIPEDRIRGLGLGPEGLHRAVEKVEDPALALYELTGRLKDGRWQAAWIRGEAVRRGTVPAGDEMGENAGLNLPMRSRWVSLKGSSSQTGGLLDSILRIHRAFAWELLQSSPEAGASFPYELIVTRKDGSVVEDGRLLGGRDYFLGLKVTTGSPVDLRQVERRFVYVFAIDSSGGSSLLYPQLDVNSENRWPLSKISAPRRIDFGESSRFGVNPPYGIDRFFLFTSIEPILDPADIFQYDGVRGLPPTQTGPLGALLTAVSSTRRGFSLISTPTTWSIRKETFRTRP